MRLPRILVISAVLLAFAGVYTASASAADPPAAPAPPAQMAPSVIAPLSPLPPPSPAATTQNDALREAGITPEVAQRLTNSQLFEILQQHARRGDHGAEGVVVPMAFFLFLFLGVSVGLYISFRRDRERQQTLRAMVERGGTIPPELLVPPVKKFADLRRGITLLAVGFGLSIFLGVMPTEHGAWTAGLIPILLGGGYLLTWKLTRPGPHAIRDEAAIAAEREVQSL